MDLIPAIDIIEGKCVRLTQGNYNLKTVYREDPLELAIKFEDHGIKRLHLVDLDGAKAGRIVNHGVLEKIATKTNLKIDFGGGIKTEQDVDCIFNYGASIATIGSLAVKNKLLFFECIKKYGSEKILLGADVKKEIIQISGWLEETEIHLFDFINENTMAGIKHLFCTDISKDGKMEGPAFDLYKRIIVKHEEIRLIASGGISSMQDVFELEKIGCAGAIIGKAIYEGKINLIDLKKFGYAN